MIQAFATAGSGWSPSNRLVRPGPESRPQRVLSSRVPRAAAYGHDRAARTGELTAAHLSVGYDFAVVKLPGLTRRPRRLRRVVV